MARMVISECRALIFGAGGGIGGVIAREMGHMGARTALSDRRDERLAGTEASMGANPPVLCQVMDVLHEEQVEGFVAEASDRLGSINCCVNAIGVLGDGVLAEPMGGWTKKQPVALWDRVIATNLRGAFLIARAAAGAMLSAEQSGDRVIANVSSAARAGNLGQGAYAASKAGLEAASRSWALELGRAGIRVFTVSPGLIGTPMLQSISHEAINALTRRTPLGRVGEASDVWLAIRFGIECEFLTGETIELTGGLKFGGL